MQPTPMADTNWRQTNKTSEDAKPVLETSSVNLFDDMHLEQVRSIIL